jgi:hypothetical protein
MSIWCKQLRESVKIDKCLKYIESKDNNDFDTCYACLADSKSESECKKEVIKVIEPTKSVSCPYRTKNSVRCTLVT